MFVPSLASAWQMRWPSPPFPPVTTATEFFRSMESASREKKTYRGRSTRASPSEQRELLRALARRREVLGGKLQPAPVEPKPLAARLEAPADHPGDRAGAGHALSPLRVIVLAAAHVTDQLEYVVVAVRKVFDQPLAEKVAQFEWQAQQNISRFLHPGGRRGIEDALDLHVVDRGNDRRDHHGGRDTGLREFAQRFEPSGRRRGTRLHHTRQLRIEARHRESHL